LSGIALTVGMAVSGSIFSNFNSKEASSAGDYVYAFDSAGPFTTEISDGLIPAERISTTNSGGAVITASFYKNSSTLATIFNNSSGETRLYTGSGNDGGQLTFALTGDYVMKSITVNTSTNTGYSINGGSTITTSGVETALADLSSVELKNVGTGQVRITSLEIGYSATSSKILTDIAVSGTLTKTAYYVGESFDPSGLTITATYDDLTTKDVTSSCSFTDLTEGLTSVTATYVEGEVTKTAVIGGITVSVRTVSSISVLANPTKMSYLVGQSFNPAGMKIRATYNMGPTDDDYSAYTYAPTAAFDSLGAKIITITSTDNPSATATLEINAGATEYTKPMDPTMLVINKSNSESPDITFSDISENVRLFGSPITGSIMIGNGSTSGGSFKMTLDSGLYVSKIEFVGNDKDSKAAGTATLSVNNASVNFSDITAEDSVILKPYSNSITITTTARLWVEQIVITAQKASTCALDYGTHFLTCTSGECLTGNVSSATLMLIHQFKT